MIFYLRDIYQQLPWDRKRDLKFRESPKLPGTILEGFAERKAKVVPVNWTDLVGRLMGPHLGWLLGAPRWMLPVNCGPRR